MEQARWFGLVESLSDQDVEVCASAAEALHAEAGTEDVPNLLALLKDERFFVREAAAWPLAELMGPVVLPQLFAAYQRGFDQGHDNDGFTGALLEIPALFPLETKAQLEAMIAISEEPTRGHAIWLLEFVPSAPENDA